MEALASKLGLYFALFVTELYIFLISFRIVNIVLHVILFQPVEYQELIILPSEILSNQAHMTFCAKLSDLLYIKLKIAIQVAKTYIYSLVRVLSGRPCTFFIYESESSICLPAFPSSELKWKN